MKFNVRSWALILIVTTDILLVGVPHVTEAASSTTTGSPPMMGSGVITDPSGNRADANSHVTWAPLPPTPPYETVLPAAGSDGLLPLVNLATSFVNTVQQSGYPADLINRFQAGTFDIATEYKEVVFFAIGIIICVAIGFLFVIIMPIVGCCFCCCRLCGNCGGKRIQKPDPNAGCQKIIFTIITIILGIMMGVGCVCMFFTNQRFTQTVSMLNSSITTNINDIGQYMNNIGNELDYVGSNNFNFTRVVIFRDLDDIGNLVGVPVRTTLLQVLGVNALITNLLNFDQQISDVGHKLSNVNTSETTIKTDGATLQSSLAVVKAAIDGTKPDTIGCALSCQAISTTGLTLDADFQALPNISGQMAEMQSVLANNFSDLALQGKSSFDNIPETVTNDTVNVVKEMKDKLNSLSSTIESTVKSVKDMSTQVSNTLSSYQGMIGTYLSYVPPYDKYRWIAGIVLACIVLLVVLLQLFGALFGIIGHSSSVKPTERGCPSNSGGHCLMAAVAFIFIFSWLLMLLSTLTFIIGLPLEKFVCQPITDPKYTVIKEALDGPGGPLASSPTSYPIGQLLLNNGSIDLTISGILQSCKQNEAAYSALKLSSRFDLTSITDYRKSIDIQAEVNKMNIDLSSVQLMSTATENQLQEFSSATQIDYQGFRNQLTKNTTATNLTVFAQALTAVANDGTNSLTVQATLLQAATDLTNIQNGIYTTVATEQTNLLAAINALQTTTAAIPVSVNNTINQTRHSEQMLHSLGPGIINAQANLYANRLLGIADSFSNHTLDAIENDVGGCQPIWTLWDSLLQVAFCEYTVDTLNCFWLSIGWSIFFMVPSIIFNVRLAKHFRQMKYSEEFEKSGKGNSQAANKISNGNTKAPPKFASSKVAPIN